ncbi:MAG TPA: replicative DNA helicase [Candidatus Competibacteraceae bacterium]|nr:replicative DNA helicase [Candidatus Competibacteraceae bacterium]
MQPIASFMDRKDPAADALKVPPHSIEAEQAVLGGLMLDNAAWDQIADRIGETDFYRADHRLIFQAIRGLAERAQPFDVVTLSEWLDSNGKLEEAGGLAYLATLARDTPSAANIRAYADIVRERSVLRQLIRVGTDIASSAYFPEGRNSAELLELAEKNVFAIAEQGKRQQQGFQSINHLLTKAVDRIDTLFQLDNPITGVPTGWRDFDEMTAGLQPGDLIIIAGRPSMGKCIASGSRLLDPATGRLRTIDEMVRQQDGRLVTVDGDHRLQQAEASHFVDDGIKPVFRVRTALGREIVTTLTHPFLALDGWCPLAALRVGDRIAVPRRLPYFGRERWPAQQVKRLAYQVASADRPTLARIDANPRLRADCEAALRGGGERRAVGSAVRALREQDGPVGSLPPTVFALVREQLALFLNRLFACGASVCAQAGAPCGIGYRTASTALARDVQHLLLRFGINATLRHAAPAAVGPGGSELHISAPEDVLGFIREIGILGQEQALERLAERLHEAQAAHVASSDLYWDRIEAIEHLGRRQVYDLTVPQTHNFIAEDMLVHNTTFAMNIAEHAAIKLQQPVAVFSMEMPGEHLAMRMMSSLGRIDQHRIRTGKLEDDDWPRLTSAVSILNETKLFIDDSAGLSPAEVRARCRRLAREHGQLALVLVDYLQLMRVPGNTENRATEISEISRSLKALAKELHVPVIALSQLNRSLEQRPNKRPVMSDLRESGAIEQDADLICFIYRDEVYDPDSPDKGVAEIIIGKQRNGPIGTVRLTFLGKYTRFENFMPESYTDGGDY